jgi:hypothetical protein
MLEGGPLPAPVGVGITIRKETRMRLVRCTS